MDILNYLFKSKLSNPYDSGSPIHFNFDETFLAKSRYGFWIPVRVTGLISRIDNDKFREGLMLEQKNRSRLVMDAIEQALLPTLHSHEYFFAYGWSGEHIDKDPRYTFRRRPMAFAYKRQAENGGPPVQWTRQEMRELLSRVTWEASGCSVCFFGIDTEDPGILSNKNVEENLAMFKNMKLTLEEDEFYKAFEEFVCINAIHRRTEVWREFQKLQTQQEHRVGNLVVEVQGEGTKFKISWQNEEPDSEVMGFRKEESFSLNKWSETENGIFFVNSYVTKGHTIESLEAGKTYYYTFFTKSWNLGSNQLPLRNAIRFALSVPSQEDIEKLETFIANSQAKSESPEQEVYQRFKAKMRNLTDFYKIRDTIIEEIENDTSLPRPTKESLIAVCRDMSIDEEERVERLS